MEYRIRLDRMEFRAFHGCYDLEQQVGNRFTVDLEVVTELGEVAEKDDVTLAVNYLDLYGLVRQTMQQTQRTIERVALNIIRTTKEAYPQIRTVRCRVTKLAPPLGGKVQGVSVELEE